MNDDSRKRLYNYLGEDMEALCRIGMDRGDFDHWRDLGALVEKIMEKGEWETFWFYVYNNIWETEEPAYPVNYAKWLFANPTRFCELVAEWLKGKEKVCPQK